MSGYTSIMDIKHCIALFFRNINRGIISSKVAKRIIETLVDLAIFRDRDNICTNFEKKYKQIPPNFITISSAYRLTNVQIKQ